MNSYDKKNRCGDGLFSTEVLPECSTHDINDLMESSKQESNENDENFVKSLWFRYLKTHYFTDLIRYIVYSTVATTVAPFYNHDKERITEHLKQVRSSLEGELEVKLESIIAINERLAAHEKTIDELFGEVVKEAFMSLKPSSFLDETNCERPTDFAYGTLGKMNLIKS